MKTVSKLSVLAVLLNLSTLTFAEGGGSYASHDSITTGSGAAAAGTNLYNTLMKPKNPLPVHGGDDAVIRQTLRNMGAGQGLKEAWSNATMSESGADQISAPKSAKKTHQPEQRLP